MSQSTTSKRLSSIACSASAAEGVVTTDAPSMLEDLGRRLANRRDRRRRPGRACRAAARRRRCSDGSGCAARRAVAVARRRCLPRGCAATSGNVTQNVAPLPAPALSARTVPPCRSTMWRTMARPRPRPPNSPRRRAVLLREAIEDVRQELRLDSAALVAHAHRRAAVDRRQGDRHAPALRAELDGVGQEVRDDLEHAHRIGARRSRFPARRRRRSAPPWSARARSRSRAPPARPRARSTSSGAIVSLPATMRETSSRSSMSWICSRVLRSMVSPMRCSLGGVDASRDAASATA